MRARISRVKRCLRLPGNAAGRDLVVGDLHGHRGLLDRELESRSFDPACDRLFSVGDLVNRGPDSLATLSLIEEPWFHAVLGNHDLMLLNYLGYYSSRIHSRRSFSSGAGEWVEDALSRHRRQLRRLADRLAGLPLAIHVESSIPFNVLHGDLAPLGQTQACLFDETDVCVHEADRSTSSRFNFHEALDCAWSRLQFKNCLVRVSDQAFRNLPLTYVGHSRVQEVMIHNSYIYIDQGAYRRGPRNDQQRPPTVVDHEQFSAWLKGVALARVKLDPSGTAGMSRQPLRTARAALASH